MKRLCLFFLFQPCSSLCLSLCLSLYLFLVFLLSHSLSLSCYFSALLFYLNHSVLPPPIMSLLLHALRVHAH